MSFLYLIPITLSVIMLLLGYIYFIWKFNYWKQRGVNGPTPKPLSGTFPKSMLKNENIVYDHLSIYSKFKSTDKFVGVFTVREPELLIISPELVLDIFIANFKNFHDNAVSAWVDHSVDKLIGLNPFLLTGELWKEKRSQIVPALTSNKLKITYPVIQKVCQNITNFIRLTKENNSSRQANCFDAKRLALQFTGDVLIDSVYGLKGKAFTLDRSKNSYLDGMNDFISEFLNGFIRMSYANVIPFFTKIFNIKFSTQPTEKFFMKLLNDAIEMRLKSQNERGDFLDYLIHLQTKQHLNNIDVCAQALTIALDGYETTATLICHCLLLLARNQKSQDHLRTEIQDNFNKNGDLDYDTLMDMNFLDQCINESLRIFPPILYSFKKCTQEIALENSNGKKITIYPGQTVQLPLHAIHHDPEYYPNPEEFIPERFSEENGGAKKFRDEGKFYPFGAGPRICIGMKFGLIQSKSAICELVRNFRITVNEKTRVDNKVGSANLFAMLDGGIWLDFEEIKK